MMCGCDGGWYGGDASLNSLTAMARICSHFFFELRASLITFRIFVR